jgi:long-chain acyl-CoA synthetase
MTALSPPDDQHHLSRMIARTLREGGNADALEYHGVWHSWSELAGLADCVAAHIGNECERTERIGLVARNRPTVLAAMLGLISQGHTVVMLHGAQKAERLASEIADLELAAVIAEDEFWHPDVLAAASRGGSSAIVLPDGLDGELRHILPKRPRTGRVYDPAVALELLSSGTTGPPKRVPIHWRTLELALCGAHGTALFAKPAAPLSGRSLPPAISGLSLGNIGGVYMMLPSVLIGQPIVMLDKFAVDPWVAAVKRYRPDMLSVQPVGLRMILEADVPPDDLSSLSTIVSGASRLDPDLQDAFERRYGVRVFGAYGATETCGSIIVWTDALYERFRDTKRGSVGKPIAGVEVCVTDPRTGAEVPTGTTGLLNARVDRVGPDWIKTTDFALVDEDGFVYVTGRADDAIDRGGYSIPPDTVVDVLRRHPAVKDASVVGIPDERLGEVPVAAIELVKGATEPREADLIEFVRDHLLAYQVPVRIICVTELPRNASLKIMIPAVREFFVAT